MKGELFEFQKKYGTQDMYQTNIGNIGIESWLSYSDQIENRVLRTKLYELFEGKREISEVKVEDVKGALQFTVVTDCNVRFDCYIFKGTNFRLG